MVECISFASLDIGLPAMFYKRQSFFFQSAVLDCFLTVNCKIVKMDECNGRFYGSVDSVLMKKTYLFPIIKKPLHLVYEWAISSSKYL